MTLLFLGLIGGLFGLGRSEIHNFERKAAADIQSKLRGDQTVVTVKSDVGPEALFGDIREVRISAAHFSTDGLPLYTEPKRSHRGVVRMLKIGLSDFTVRGLHVNSMDVAIPDCRFDFALALNHRQIRLSRSGEGDGEVVIDEKSLESYILTKFHEIKRVKVRIDKDKVFVEGYGEFLFLKSSFTVIAKLESPDGNRLMLTYAHILLDGHPADDAQRQVLLDTLNPVVDLDNDVGLDGAIRVQAIELRDGVLRVSGRTRIPDAPAAPPPAK